MTQPQPTPLPVRSTQPVGSPEWWRDRLYGQLRARMERLERWDAYYCGDHPLPWLPEQARDPFLNLLRMTRSNYMGLVCDALAERLQVQGFRFGQDEDSDAEAWRIWQANDLDADFDLAILEAVILGSSYLLVAPNPAEAAMPLITVEHPSQAIVEYQPGSRRQRAAGLKAWRDDWTGRLMATLYLPGGLWKWQADHRPGQPVESLRWRDRAVPGERRPAPNPLKAVPLFELQNRARMLGGGVSEIADVTDIQDRVNKTLADRLMTQDFGAFPQKWATGVDLDAQFRAGRDRMFQAEEEGARFGQFDAAALEPYSTSKREDVKDIASRTRTPAQYLLGEMSNVNGETLKASESGLVSKCRQRQRPLSEAAESVMRAAFGLAGDEQRATRTDAETIWRNPEFRTEGELVDALVKMGTLGVPNEALWEKWGATPQERQRWARLRDEAVTRAGVGDLAALVAGPRAADIPGSDVGAGPAG